jgi:hypothetical protein
MTIEQHQDNPKTNEELILEFKNNFISEVKIERTKRLAETDYIHMPDVILPDNIKSQIVEYRQKLREFPEVVNEWLVDKDLFSVSIWGLPWPVNPRVKEE